MQVPREYMDAHKLRPNTRLRFAYEGDRLMLSPFHTETPAEKEARERRGDATAAAQPDPEAQAQD